MEDWGPNWARCSARCETCPLEAVRDAAFVPTKPADAGRPEGGLLILGEGPGGHEVAQQAPFVGPAGRVLDQLLHHAGIDRSLVHIGNVTSCLPAAAGAATGRKLAPLRGKDKEAALGAAVPACRPRVLDEIARLRPRVIVAFGAHAMRMLTGVEQVRVKRVKFTCETCGGQAKWRVYRCAKCKDDAAAVATQPTVERTPCCQAKWQPKWVKCPACDGKKTREVEQRSFSSDYRLAEVAGGVWDLQDLPIGDELRARGFDVDATRPLFGVCTYHPAHLMRDAETKAGRSFGGQFLAQAAVAHLRKAKRILTTPPRWDVRYLEESDPERIARFLTPMDRYAVDIETDNKNPFDVSTIRCLSFAPYTRETVLVVDTEGLPTSHPRLASVLQFLADPARTKTFQNGVYDTTVIALQWNVLVGGYAADTQYAHTALTPDEPHDLSHIVFTYTDAAPWKPPKVQGGLQVFDSKEELHLYNARDARGTAEVDKALQTELDEEGLRTVVDLDIKKAHMAVSMTLAGMHTDRREALSLDAEYRYEEEQALLAMQRFVGPLPPDLRPKPGAKTKVADPSHFNPYSTDQLRWVLFAPEGPSKLVPSKFTDEARRQASTDMGALMLHTEHPFVRQLLAFRAAVSQRRKINELTPRADGRFHVLWKPDGSRSGRWTSNPNALNGGSVWKRLIVAPPGRKIVGFDLPQAELRVIAGLARERKLFELCVNANESRKLEPTYDPHSYVATFAFGSVYEELSLADPRHDKAEAKRGRCACETCTRNLYRFVVKRVIYGMNYGAGDETVLQAIYDGGYSGPPITIRMVHAAAEGVNEAFPAIVKYRNGEYAEACRTGKLEDALIGRRRVFPMLRVPFTEAANFKIQSTVASLMDILLWDVFLALPSVDPTALLIAQIHDAAYMECNAAKAQAVADMVTRTMSSSITFYPDEPPMPFPVQAQIADNMKEAA